MAITTAATAMPQQQQQQQPSTNTNTIESTTTVSTMVVLSDYEQTREQRIKENRERLQKLGIVDLSLQLKSISSTASRRTTPQPSSHRNTPLKSPSVGPTEPRRRSSRLQNAPPVTYVEPKEEKSRKSRDIVLEVGSKPEFYTEEHEKLLGNTEMPWEFFVDGYAADGTRIYDPVKGKTCHQCRQKTLGQRTRCCQCNLVQGQFCGDCLYTRYGEHVLEANQNPNWICPPCRGICNCSLCRQAKGWPPTGMLYKRISRLGYKSVAHYLMATKRAPPEENTITDKQQLAKRCLPFEGMQVPTDNIPDEKATDEANVTHGTEPNQILEESVMNGQVNLPSDGMQLPTDNASDENAADENYVSHEFEPDQTPEESVMNGKVVEDVVPVEKRPVGRPRKRIESHNPDVAIHVEKRPVGRPRKRSLEKKIDADLVVHVKKRPTGRPRNRSIEENINSGEEPLSTDNQKTELNNSTSVTGSASDDKVTDESNAKPDIGPNQTPESVVDGEIAQDVLVIVKKGLVETPRKGHEKENLDTGVEPLSTDVKKDGFVSEVQSPHSSTILKCRVPFECMPMPTINASDEKATDENNVTSDTKTNQTPEESVMEGMTVEDVVHVEKRSVGRPRKRLEDHDAVVAIHVEKRPIGRPKKRSMEENFDTDVVVHVKKRPVGRPRKRSMEENLKSDEEPLSIDVKKNELHNSISVADNASDDKATDESSRNPDSMSNQTSKSLVSGEVSQDVHVIVKKRPVGRPRKGSEKVNLNTGAEPLSTDVQKNEFVSEMQSPHSSNNVTDSVARRLRSTNKT